MSESIAFRAITIITVVRNAAEALETTIRSIAPHLAPGIDYVIIDGASTDGTCEVIRRHHGLLKAWHSAPDRGVYDAMNRGWELANPESWVLYLGAGDRLLALPQPEEFAGNPNTVIYGKVELGNGVVFHPRVGYWLRLYNSLHHQALLIPRDLHRRPPFNLSFPLYADFDFNQRLLKQGARFRFSANFHSYAAPGGLTQELAIGELSAVTGKNFGPVWSGLARAGYLLSRHFPLLHKLRPIQ
jgi:glycosyltransferase involved in cell wall biosynthesis